MRFPQRRETQDYPIQRDAQKSWLAKISTDKFSPIVASSKFEDLNGLGRLQNIIRKQERKGESVPIRKT